MINLVLATVNVSYIHRNLALRWLYVAKDKETNVQIKEFNCKQAVDDMIQELLCLKVDVIGFSVYIYNLEIIKELVVKLKTSNKNLRIILGGPEINWDDTWWFDMQIEALLVGEAEKSLYQYLKTGKADGVKTKDYCSDIKEAIVDIAYLESLASPYFLTDYNIDYHQQYFYLETSRGCPFLCSYCSAAGKKLRLFSKEYIKKLLNEVAKHDIKQIKLLDRSFNANEKHALFVIEEIAELKLETIVQFEITADKLSDAFINKLIKIKKPSCFRFEIGIQTFNKESLKAINRHQDNELLVKRIKQLHQHGFIIHTDLIAGLPYEDLSSFKKSFNKLYSLKTEEIQVGILKLLKNSPLYNQIEIWDIKFASIAPYQIISSKWLSENDIEEVSYVALATEKLYNNQRMLHTLAYLLDELKLEPFAVFAKLGKTIENLKQPYNLYDLFVAVNKEFSSYCIKQYLNIDYYSLFNIKTKRLFSDTVAKDERVMLRKYLVDNKILDDYLFSNYSTICKEDDCYLLFVIMKDEKYPKVLIIDKEKIC